MSAIIGDTYAEVDLPDSGELLSELRSGQVRGEVVIYPAGAEIPRATVDWHPERGFVVWCLDSEQSIGHFLASHPVRTEPGVEIVLGGQAMERWPLELFVSDDLAAKALTFLAESGGRKPELCWIAADEFHRETVWEGTEGRQAWERTHKRFSNGD